MSGRGRAALVARGERRAHREGQAHQRVAPALSLRPASAGRCDAAPDRRRAPARRAAGAASGAAGGRRLLARDAPGGARPDEAGDVGRVDTDVSRPAHAAQRRPELRRDPDPGPRARRGRRSRRRPRGRTGARPAPRCAVRGEGHHRGHECADDLGSTAHRDADVCRRRHSRRTAQGRRRRARGQAQHRRNGVRRSVGQGPHEQPVESGGRIERIVGRTRADRFSRPPSAAASWAFVRPSDA
jgi:hypothetical protein